MRFKLHRAWIGIVVLLGAMAAASAERRKDAAEAVQEGSVANWMEYYKRERGNVPPKEPARPPAQTDQPPAQTSR